MTLSSTLLPDEPPTQTAPSPVFLPQFVREFSDLSPSLRAEFERYLAAYDSQAGSAGDESLLDAVGGLANVRFIESLLDLLLLIGQHPGAALAYNSVLDPFLNEEGGADLWTLHYVGEADTTLIVVPEHIAENARQMMRYDGGSATPYGSVAWFASKEVK